MKVGLALPGKIQKFPLADALSIAEMADDRGFHSLWTGEASGINAFMLLAAVADRTTRAKLGTGIANVFSRTPTLLAMSVATLDELSDGRAMVGLGASTEPLVADWHGMAYERPLRRLRETIEILKLAFREETVRYEGTIFDIGPYPRQFETVQSDIRVFNSAMGEANRRLTAEFADGWMPMFCPKSRLEARISELQSSVPTDDGGADEPLAIAPWVPAAVSDDPAVAERRMRELLAQEIGVGYERVISRHGFAEPAQAAARAWNAGDRHTAAEAITDRMLDEFTVFGTPATVADGLRHYHELGVDWPILWTAPTASRGDLEHLVETVGDRVC